MALQMSRYLENKIIRLTLRNEAYTPPPVVYLGLFTTPIEEAENPATEAMVGTELSGGGYARQSITFTAPVDGATSNGSTVTFPISTTDWGLVTHWAVFDNVTGGNMLYYGAMDVSRDFITGQQAVVSPNRITVKLD